MVNNFLRDYTQNIFWPREDVETLQGQLSYLNQIEPGYYNYITAKYSFKYRTILKTAIKAILEQ